MEPTSPTHRQHTHAKPIPMSPQQLRFDNEVVEKLMVLSPEVTKEQIRAYNDEEKLEKFKRYIQKLRLRDMEYAQITTMDRLDLTLNAIKSCLRFVVTSATFLNLLSRKLLKSTRLVQNFTRRAILHHRETKNKLLEDWKIVEAEARKKIRAEIEFRASRSRSQTSQRAIEEMWEVYMKCWVSKEDMTSAINHVWTTHRASYLERYRAWKKRTKETLEHHPQDTITKRRQREWSAYTAYPPMRWKATTVSIAELAAHLNYLQQQKVARSVNAEVSTIGRTTKKVIKEVGPADKLVSPVSYYHLLLKFDRTKFHLALFLKQLTSGEQLRLPPGPTPAIREQAAEAKAIWARWCGNNDILGTAVPTSKKNVIGPDGQPFPRYGGWSPLDDAPSRRPSSAISPSLNASSRTTSPRGTKKKDSSKDVATAAEGDSRLAKSRPSILAQHLLAPHPPSGVVSASPSRSAKSGHIPSPRYAASESPSLDNTSITSPTASPAAVGSHASQRQKQLLKDAAHRTTVLSRQLSSEASEIIPLMPSADEKKRAQRKKAFEFESWRRSSSTARHVFDPEVAESMWRAAEGKNMLRRPQTARAKPSPRQPQVAKASADNVAVVGEPNRSILKKPQRIDKADPSRDTKEEEEQEEEDYNKPRPKPKRPTSARAPWLRTVPTSAPGEPPSFGSAVSPAELYHIGLLQGRHLVSNPDVRWSSMQ